MPDDPIDPRTGKVIERAKTLIADIGHAICPKCQGRQSAAIGVDGKEQRVCANCGFIFDPETNTVKQ